MTKIFNINNVKKASSEIGIGIIILSVLLLLGGIFSDNTNPNLKSDYNKYKNDKNNKIQPLNNQYKFIDENIIFQLNNTNIGREKKISNAYPNIELGSKSETNVIFTDNPFRLNANLFTSNIHKIKFNAKKIEDVNEFLIYYKGKRISGMNDLIIKINSREISRNKGENKFVPITYYNELKNSSVEISFELEKPKWYELFNWNKFDLSEIKIVEIRRNSINNKREFDFDIEKADLKRVYIDLLINCDENRESSEAIKVSINGYIVSNQNPNCNLRNKKITIGNISKNILNEDKNRLVFETNGHYTLAYNINKVYYSDKFNYKFTMANFNNVIDVIMFGEFDREVVDIRINNKLLSLRRDEIKAIYQYIRYGTNEIEFINKPLEIEEFTIEKSDYYSY